MASLFETLSGRFDRSSTGSRHSVSLSSHSQRKKKDKDPLSSTGHSVSSVKSFASFDSSADCRSQCGEPRRSCPPLAVFVGRTKHIKRLTEEFESDEARFVLIHGPSGCGKTWLLEEFRRVQQGAEEGCHNAVLYSSFARLSQYEDPYAPVWQALVPYLDQRQDLVQEFFPVVRSFLPHLCTRSNMLRAYDSSPSGVNLWDRERQEAFMMQLLRRLLTRNQRESEDALRVIIWCLDDLDDAAPETLRLLQHILLTFDRIHFLGSCLAVKDNKSHFARWLVHLKRHKLGSSALALRPLSNFSLQNIIHLIYQQYLWQRDYDQMKNEKKGNFVRALAKQVEGYTGGHALTVSQLLRLLHDLGCFPEGDITDSPHTFLDKVAKLPMDTPTCLQRVIRLRLRALPDPAKTILRMASAYSSRVFSAESLYCLCRDNSAFAEKDNGPILPAEVQDLLAYTARAGFLVCLEGDSVFGFVHPFVRDIVSSGYDPLHVHYELGLAFRNLALCQPARTSSVDCEVARDAPSTSELLDARGVYHWNRLHVEPTGQGNEEPLKLSDLEAMDLAIWNHRVASQASRRHSWFVAAKHFETAFSLLDSLSESAPADLTVRREELWLEWACDRIQAELACGRYDSATNLATRIRSTRTSNKAFITRARSTFVTVSYRQSIHGSTASNAGEKAVQCCLKWLGELGDSLPDLLLACSASPSKCVEALLRDIKVMLAKFDFAPWRGCTLVTNEDIQFRMVALRTLADVSVVLSPSHHTIAMLRGLQLSLQYGRFAMTPLCFVALADALVQRYKWAGARQYAEAGREMALEGLDTEMDTRALVVYTQLAVMWGDSGASSEGDSIVRNAEVLLWESSWTIATCAKLAWFWSQFSFCSLDSLAQGIREFLQVLLEARQFHLSTLVVPCLELVETLRDSSEVEMDERTSFFKGELHHFPIVKRYVYLCRMVSSFWRNDTSQASTWLDMLTPEGEAFTTPCSEMRSATDHPTLVFLQGLVVWNLVSEQRASRSCTTKGTNGTKKLMRLCQLGEAFTRQLEVLAAVQCRKVGGSGSSRARALLHLLRAQDDASRQHAATLDSMLSSYDAALAEMERANVGRGLLAISLEQAGLCLRRHYPSVGSKYLRRSLDVYRAWGAQGKALEVEKLLRELLDQESVVVLCS